MYFSNIHLLKSNLQEIVDSEIARMFYYKGDAICDAIGLLVFLMLCEETEISQTVLAILKACMNIKK